MDIVILSIPERDNVRARTLEQLSKHNIFPSVTIQSNPVRGGLIYRAYCRAVLKKSLMREPSHILFLEDDLNIGEGFGTALSVASQSGFDVVTFYNPGLRFYPAKIKRAIVSAMKYTPGIYKLVNRKRFFGSQALLLKSRFAKRLLNNWPKECYLDTAIANFANEIYLYAPNPIQHYGACLKSTWSSQGKPHFSKSYIG